MYTMPRTNRSKSRANVEEASKSKKQTKRSRTRNTRSNRVSDKITAGSGKIDFSLGKNLMKVSITEYKKYFDDKKGHEKYSALQKACMKSRVDIREIQRIIASIEFNKKAKANAVEYNIALFNKNSTPKNLDEGSYRQVTKAMEDLIAEAKECNEKLNYRDERFGETALHLLCKHSKDSYTTDTVAAVNCLLTAGADPDIRRFVTVSQLNNCLKDRYSNRLNIADGELAIDLVRKHIDNIVYDGVFDGMPVKRNSNDLRKYSHSLENLKEIRELLLNAKDRRLNIRDGNRYGHEAFLKAYSKVKTIAERAWRDQEHRPEEAPQTPVLEGPPSKRQQLKRRTGHRGVTQVKTLTKTIEESKTTPVKASKRKQKRPKSRRRKTHTEAY